MSLRFQPPTPTRSRGALPVACHTRRTSTRRNAMAHVWKRGGPPCPQRRGRLNESQLTQPEPPSTNPPVWMQPSSGQRGTCATARRTSCASASGHDGGEKPDSRCPFGCGRFGTSWTLTESSSRAAAGLTRAGCAAGLLSATGAGRRAGAQRRRASKPESAASDSATLRASMVAAPSHPLLGQWRQRRRPERRRKQQEWFWPTSAMS
mmetsp:Transcript_6088/g.17617  ORF Transcript_6088/g.17617 Transcript_6088/m.17617 type:complete len:207 (+) Transcript_6088:78-698(+)